MLADAEEVDVLRTADGETAYRRCSRGHHHHLVCRHCGRTVEVDGPAVERWADRIASDHGFVEIEHTLEIFGTCQDCSAKRRIARSASELAVRENVRRRSTVAKENQERSARAKAAQMREAERQRRNARDCSSPAASCSRCWR